MTIKDNRTDEHRKTHTTVVVARNLFAPNQIFVYLCLPEDNELVAWWVLESPDLEYLDVVLDTWSELHSLFYIPVGEGHPALAD